MRWPTPVLFLLLSCSFAAAQDWPQWLGPNRDGVSSERVLPWKRPPQVIWRQPVGEGNSSPVVSNGRVFLHAKVRDRDEEEVLALDADSGKELWRTSYPRAAFKSLYGNGPRATPAVAGGRVYTFGITGLLTSFDAAQGKKIWQVDTLQEFSGKNLFFGMSCSPLVHAGQVLVNVGGKGASIVAFDADSGKVEPIGVNSDMVLNYSAEKAYIFDHSWRQFKEKLIFPDLRKVDWDFYYAAYRKFLPYINNNYDFAEMMSEMLGEMNVSHTGAYYNAQIPNSDATASLGLFYDYDYTGNGVRRAEVIHGGPVDLAASAAKTGNITEQTDGTAIHTSIDS